MKYELVDKSMRDSTIVVRLDLIDEKLLCIWKHPPPNILLPFLVYDVNFIMKRYDVFKKNDDMDNCMA